MLAFLAAVFLLLITPGPGVLSTAGVGAGFGARAGYRYLIGLFIGTNLVALAVVTGLAGLVLASPNLRTVLLYLSVAYLGYLALRIALADTRIAFKASAKAPGVVAAVTLQLINPKAYVVNTALFTGFPFAGQQATTEILLKFLLINLIWIPIHLLWLAAGIALQRMAVPPRWQRVINVSMAMALLAVVALALAATPS